MANIQAPAAWTSSSCPGLFAAFAIREPLGTGAVPRLSIARRVHRRTRPRALECETLLCPITSVACVGCIISRNPQRRGAQIGRACQATGEAGIIDGKAIASQVRAEVREGTEQLKVLHGVTPGLAVVLVGDRPDSASYVRGKSKAAQEVGCRVLHRPFPEGVSEEELLQCIEELNADAEVHGILVQLPLPAGLDEQRILGAIHVQKDVDGLSPENMGLLAQGAAAALPPCTAAGCMELLRRSGVELEGKECLVLGRSRIVGLPMALLLLQANATVKVCHSRSLAVAEACAGADVIVAAVGQPEFVQGDWLREGCVILDVGINRVPQASSKRGYRLVGDVDFAAARSRASQITPVPGGVGPMTVAMLLKNTLILAMRATSDSTGH